nr:MAG TPA_asm: hypothetical protein [Caudoviricetes sp.]
MDGCIVDAKELIPLDASERLSTDNCFSIFRYIFNCVTAAAFYPLLLHVTMQFSIYLHPAYADIIL